MNRTPPNNIKTDCDLIIAIDHLFTHAVDPSLQTRYEKALDFESSCPDYSLVQYRDSLSTMTELLADSFAIDINDLTLEDKIDILHRQGRIHFPLKNQMHQLRKYGNQGAHSSQLARSAESHASHSASNEKQTRQSYLQELAKQARKLFLSIAEDVYRICGQQDGSPSLRLELMPSGKQHYKDTLFNAIAEGDNWVRQLEAGMTYEMLVQNIGGYVLSPAQRVEVTALRKRAIACFEAAWQLSVKNYDQLKIDVAFDAARNKHTDSELLNRCDTEPLYRECLLRLTLLENEDSDKGFPASEEFWLVWRRLLRAAERNHCSANTLAGKIFLIGLPGQDPEFGQALRYLNKALELGASDAYIVLHELYASDNTGSYKDIDKAIEMLEQGIQRECADCHLKLGELLISGELLDPDMERAEDLMRKAVDLGNIYAQMRWDYHFGTLREDVGKCFMEIAADLKSVLIPAKKQPVRSRKTGRNDPCPCGSGIKFKRCCIT